MRKAFAYSLPAAGLLLAALFFLPAYHALYWSHPLVFAPLTALGAAAALGGGFLAGRALRERHTPTTRAAAILRAFGALLTLLAAGLGAAALLLALSIANTGYWGSPPAAYGGDYLVLLLQIRLSQAAAAPGVAGGLLLGLGRAPRRA